VAALTRAIASITVGDGIRCNAIAPGTIDTPYFADILAKSADREAARKALAARQLLGRLGTPRGDRGRHPVSRERREPLRHRHDSHLGRRHDGAIVGATPLSFLRVQRACCEWRIARGRRLKIV